MSSSKKMPPIPSPRAVKKTKNAKDALKMIDLMDEDSIQFFPVSESPKKKQRMTEKQKEMMTEKKDRLPFMEDESTTTGIPKIPADIFELSVSGVEGSKSVGAKRGQMKTDFSDMVIEKKSAEIGTSKSFKKEINKSEEKKAPQIMNMKIVDDIKEESLSSSESMNEETEEETKRGGRRKSKTPKKMTMKTKEARSPSRKKVSELKVSVPVDSPKRGKRQGKIEEKNIDKKKEEEKEMEVEMNEIPSDMEVSTSRRSDKITLSLIKNGDENVEDNIDDAPLPVLDDTPISSQSSLTDNISPTKSLNEGGDLPIPSTPINRGPFDPVGILSSSKKSKSEKKRGGVHFNISEEEKIIEVVEEEGEKKEEDNKEDEDVGKEEKNDKQMVFPLLRDNDASIDTITLKLGLNSRMVKMSLEKIGVKTVGQLASMSSKEINGVMGIKPPKMRTVETVLEGVYTRSQKSGSKPLPPICTPEKMKETTVSSPKEIERIISTNTTTTPTKSKSRKRFTLSDSPIGVKKSKVEEEGEKEESKEMEVIEEKKEANEVIEEEKNTVVIDNKSENKEEKSDDVVTIDENENKENGEKKEEKEMEKPVIASVQDVLTYISQLKGGSMESLLSAHEQITLCFIEAIRDARNSQSSS